MIKHILDRVLNPEPLPESSSSSMQMLQPTDPLQANFNDFNSLLGVSDFPVFGAEMENWFDSVDLGSTNWMDVGSFAMGECRSY